MSINQGSSRIISQNKNNSQTPIYLNVYNFWSCFNKTCGLVGISVYHTGIQIFDDQYLFLGFDGDQTGVGFIQPYTAAYQFSEQILLGYTNYTYFQFDEVILDPLREQFTGNKYDLLNNNCNHFAKRLAQELKVAHNFPSKVFSVTNFFNNIRCCIPNCILNGRLDWFTSDQQQSFQSDGYPEGYKELNEQIHRKSQKSSRIKIIQDQQKNIKDLQMVKNRMEFHKIFANGNDTKITAVQNQRSLIKMPSDREKIFEAQSKGDIRRVIQKKNIFNTVSKSNQKDKEMKQLRES